MWTLPEMTDDETAALAARLESWAQNEEMIDAAFLEHGADCLEAARVLRSVAFLRRIMARMVQTS